MSDILIQTAIRPVDGPGSAATAEHTVPHQAAIAGTTPMTAMVPTVRGLRLISANTDTQTPEAYLDRLRNDPEFLRQAAQDPVATVVNLLSCELPPSVERESAQRAGSAGGGRVQMLLDLCRGNPTNRSFWKTVFRSPSTAFVDHVMGPRLFHFRQINGVNIFPNDATFAPAFQDSVVLGRSSTQVSHMLFSVEMGMRTAKLERAPIQRRAYGLAAGVALRTAGVKPTKPVFRDLARAAIVGHELIGDSSSASKQVEEFGRLIGDDDSAHIRAHFDAAVSALLKENHAQAWDHIHAIADAGEIPSTPEEMQSLAEGHNTRFQGKPVGRGGNTLQDLALSVYGFALGYMAGSGRFSSPQSAASTFERWFSAESPLCDQLSRLAEIDTPEAV